jgi:hypothetical protein
MAPRPWGESKNGVLSGAHRKNEQEGTDNNGEDNSEPERPRRTTRSQPSVSPFGEQPKAQQTRRPVKKRWFYEPVEGSKTGLLSRVAHENYGGENKMVVEACEEEGQKFLLSKNSEIE